jgi:hypothetical protein
MTEEIRRVYEAGIKGSMKEEIRMIHEARDVGMRKLE